MKINPFKIKDPFSSLSKHKKRDVYVRDHWKTINDRKGPFFKFVYNGKEFLVSSDMGLSEPNRPVEWNLWLDFVLFDSDGITIWNGEVISSTQKTWDVAYDMAYNSMVELVSPEELIKDSTIHFEPFYKNGKKFYEMKSRPAIQYPQLNNLSTSAFIKQKEKEYLLNGKIDVYPEYNIDLEYKYGIGLSMVVDEPYFSDLKVLEKYLKDFIDKGRGNYLSSQKAKNIPTIPTLEWLDKYKNPKYS